MKDRRIPRLRVERLESRELLASLVVTNTLDSGSGSLRQAILDADANSSAVMDGISFAIAGSGVQTIAPLSPLPTITRSVAIDGTTQPGFAAGGNPVVAIDGSGAGAATGLTITAGSGSVIRGLAIGGFDFDGPVPGRGIWLEGGTDALIQGNFLGVAAGGTTATPNFYGIEVDTAGNTIGGTVAGSGNVLSGNQFYGMTIGLGASGNLVEGNRIGTNAAGTGPVPNGSNGIYANAGVLSLFPPGIPHPNNTIGGTVAGEGNTIAFNQGNGVLIEEQTSDEAEPNLSIRGNSIHDNGGLGIETLGFNVSTLEQNVYITSSQRAGGMIGISGQYHGAPSTSVIIDLFANPAADPSGSGQGQVYLGATTVTTDAVGLATFAGSYTDPGFTSPILSSTVTDSAGATTPFSADSPMIPGTPSDLLVTTSVSASSVLINNPVTITFTVTNHGPSTVAGASLIASLPTGFVDIVPFTTGTLGVSRLAGAIEGSTYVSGNHVYATLDTIQDDQSVQLYASRPKAEDCQGRSRPL